MRCSYFLICCFAEQRKTVERIRVRPGAQFGQAENQGVWPLDFAARARVDTAGADELEVELTAEELEVRREHIEALGYVG